MAFIQLVCVRPICADEQRRRRLAQWSKQTRTRQIQLAILHYAPVASRGSEACLPTDQARVREEVAASPEESLQRAAVKDLQPLGLLQKRGEDGKPAAESMRPSLWPSRVRGPKSCSALYSC